MLRLLSIDFGCSLRMSCDRPNLFIEVLNKTKETLALIAAALLQQPLINQCGIIYCLSTKETEQIAAALRTRGIHAIAYHAQLSYSRREAVN